MFITRIDQARQQDLEQDYQKMGMAGLMSVSASGESIGNQIETLVLSNS